MSDEAFPDALPLQYKFHWYELERVLGRGGFGITYLARDTNLDQAVAIKEYLPHDFARRRSDAMVCARTGPLEERYRWGLERFLIEARTLARFDHPNIVRVLTVFEANGTAYMVMRFEAGENLGALLERRGTLSEAELLRILLPVLDGLEGVHRAGFIHRDIKPANIHVRNDGTPVLLDFGSARQLLGRATTMTILVAPGYAALEQYYGDAAQQGPWTDIYGLGATAYRAIAGVAPIDAIARTKGVLGSTRETMRAASDIGRGQYHDHLLAAIDHALRLNEADRPQNVAQWRVEITGSASVAAYDAALQQRGGAAKSRPVAPQTQASAQATGDATAPAPLGLSPIAAAERGLPRRTLPWMLGGAVIASMAAGASWWAALPARLPLGGATALPSEPAPATSLATPGLAAAPGLSDAGPSAPAVAPRPTDSGVPALRADVAPELSPRAELARAPAPLTHRPAASPAPPALVPDVAGRAPPLTQGRVATAAPAATAVPAPAPPVSAVTLEPAPGQAAPGAGPNEGGTKARPEAAPVEAAAASQSPTTAAATSVAAVSPRQDGARAAPPAHPTAPDPLDAAERAMGRGEHGTAMALLVPLGRAGVARAQALLGEQYEHGRGALQSDFQAYVWYSLAGRGGHKSALAAKARLAARLQPAEVQQADRLTQSWSASEAGVQK